MTERQSYSANLNCTSKCARSERNIPRTNSRHIESNGLRFTDSRHAGDIWALSELWRSLGFDDLAPEVRPQFPEIWFFLAPYSNKFNHLQEF